MSVKLTQKDGEFFVSTLRRRGKAKVLPVVTAQVSAPTREEIERAVLAQAAFLAALANPGGS